MNTNDHTFQVSCDCAICETNAAKRGLPFPLTALIRPVAATGLKITERNANKASKVHGLVYSAHDPSLIGYTGPRVSVPVS